MQLNNIINKFISPLSVFLGFLFILLNYEYVFNNSHNSYYYLLFAITFHSLYLFILNFRSFLILKNKVSQNINFISWSRIFFKSILVQDTIISQSGFIFRSVFLKSLNVKYHELITFFYFGFLSHVLINLTWVLIEINFIYEVNMTNMLIQILLVIIVYLGIYFLPYALLLLKNFFKKTNIFISELVSNQKKYFHDTNFLLFIFIITSITHILELSVFFCAFNYFLNDHNLINIIILFGIGTLSDRVPLLSSIPFVRESIFGLFSLTFGVEFLDAFLIKLLTTIASIIGSIFNLSWSLLINNIKNR